MSDKRYLGNIITQNPTAPAGNFGNSAAKGVWSLEEQLAYQKAGLWPVPGNFPLNVEEVFSTYLYEGVQLDDTDIVNGIDLDGEGGMVWIKDRSTTYHHYLYDTERGVTKQISSSQTNGEGADVDSVTAFNSNGFTIGNDIELNTSGNDYVSWTFRKAEKFFDVVTYTGDGVNFREIPHNLGSAPGLIIIKCLNSAESWMVYHKDLAEDTGTTPSSAYSLSLNGTGAASTLTRFQYSQSDTVFKLAYQSAQTNANGNTYVAYLFAHNDGDGEFGPDGDADIIKCGSFTTDGTGDVAEINLGFEPQWIMLKKTSGTGDWRIGDVMRGDTVDNTFKVLEANTSDAEGTLVLSRPTATGYKIDTGFGTNATGIYIAIRRGTKVPESATDVFAISQQLNTSGGTPSYNSGFPVDMAINKYTTGTDAGLSDRLRGAKDVLPSNTIAEYANSVKTFDYMDGYYSPGAGANSNYYSWMWKRAPSYMDVVAYTGTGSARTVAHNLGVAPEMMWVKKRSGSGNWAVYAAPLGATNYLILNSNGRTFAYDGYWNDTTPTSSVFSLKTDALVNASGSTYIAYLFATLAGISKVGSVTHSGTTNVDCGFTSGARFVLLKRTDATGDWYVWDSERGIVSGNDPYLLLNSTAAQVTNTDYIDPLSSGFTITSSFTAGDYIFYAIA